mgnify:CR=1 FL=1
MSKAGSLVFSRVCETQLDGSSSPFGRIVCRLWDVAQSVYESARSRWTKGNDVEFRRASKGRYLHGSLKFCEEVFENLIESRYVERDDIVRFGPIGSCFRWWPPRIRVSCSEVLAVLLHEKTVERWTAEGCLESKLNEIGSLVQRSSSSRATTNRFRTYVLFYIADGKAVTRDKRRNRLLYINFHETFPIDRVEEEASERRDLIVRLCYLFGRETVRRAYSCVGGDLAALNAVLDTIPFEESSRSVYTESAKNLVIGTGIASIIGLVGALGGLLFLPHVRETQAIVAAIGLVSTLGMMAAGEGAEIILESDAGTEEKS